MQEKTLNIQTVILGSGPGGYSAAFRLADLGKKVILIEQHKKLGGVCLNVGCIPSKTLLNISNIINEAKKAKEIGINFSEPEIDLNKINQYKQGVINKLSTGLSFLAKKRNVKVINGYGKFTSNNSIEVINDNNKIIINFDSCVIAVGSSANHINIFPKDDKRIMNSNQALMFENIPKNLLVVGAGIIGLEMAQFYSALGSNITIVEVGESIMPGAVDDDIVSFLYKDIKKKI